MLVEYPLAVIVNHATASAAEILAGSLQAHGRAKIVGENTFGKNTIQLVFGLEDGSSLHVTAAKWWIPAPDHPSGEGMIRPDVLLSPEGSNSEEAIRIAIDELLEE
jgi:carboxyl-terminal processing protease